MTYGSFYPGSEAVFLWQRLEFETLQELPFLRLNKLFRETAELSEDLKRVGHFQKLTFFLNLQ